jgi:glutamate carboxypeptidase
MYRSSASEITCGSGLVETGSDRILLLGHTDTVFAAGEAAKRRFQITDGRATGPGVFDMKAGILLMWSAIKALLHTQQKLERSITVLLTSDEEVGSTTSRELLESEARSARAVLVLEPSLPGGALKTARKAWPLHDQGDWPGGACWNRSIQGH